MSEEFDQAFWDERYSAHESLWSGNPNPHLVGEVSSLSAGAALDVGCGEGADAIWLAQRGWRVTAVDLSAVAIQRAADHAAAAGVTGIDWLQVDIADWEPGRYDLVSSQYMHVPTAVRKVVFGRLADAVRPGGTLLIVGHHPSDMETVPRPQQPDLYFTGADLVADLAPGEWSVVTNTDSPRTVEHDGHTVTIHDTVLRALRAGT